MDVSDLEDNEESQNKNNKAQKKRQIMGEEKTTLSFICGTFLFILILMFFHVLLFAENAAEKENTIISLQLASSMFKLEPQLSTQSNYIVNFNNNLDFECPHS